MQITRDQFIAATRSGVDVSSSNALQVFDTDNNGSLDGAERANLFDSLTQLTTDSVPARNSVTINDATAPTLMQSFSAIENPAERRIAIARFFQRDPELSNGYRGTQRMVSYNPMHNGAMQPNGRVRTHFEDTYKCNLFIGDVLDAAGVTVPTVTARDGSWTHYRRAETWMNAFPKVSREEIQPGDLLVIDYDGRGEGSGHLELVTSVEEGTVTTIGSRSAEDAIVEDGAKGALLEEGRIRPDGGYRVNSENLVVYVVRPE